MEPNHSGGGGGGGDGSGGGANGGPAPSNGNIKANNTFMYRLGPPLTALDKFSWSQQSHFLHQQNQNTAKYSNGSVWAPGFDRFPCSGSATRRFLWPNSPQETSFLDGFLASEDRNLNWISSEIPNLRLGEDIEVLGKNLKGKRKRADKKGPSMRKRKWNEEEDR